MNSLKSWLICISCSLIFFYDFIQMMLCNTIHNEIMCKFLIGITGISYLSSAFLLSNAILLFPAGLILDRISTRKVALCVITCSTISSFGFAVSNDFLLTIIFRCLSGGAHAFCFLSCMSFTSQWFTKNKQSFLISIIITIAMIGGLISQAPLSFLINNIGIHNTLLINVFLGLLILILNYIILEDSVQFTLQNKKQNTSFISSLHESINNLTNWFCGIYTAFLNLPIVLICALYGNILLMQVFFFPKNNSSEIVTMIFFGTLCGSIIYGKITILINNKKIPMIFGSLMSFVLAFIIIIMNISYNNLIIYFFFLGLFSSAQVLSYPIINENAKKNNISTTMSLVACLVMSLGGLFQLISGLILDANWFGDIVNDIIIYKQYIYLKTFLIIPFGFIVSMIISMIIRKTQN